MQYKYKGQIEVHIPMLGNVKPGETIESPRPINHPDFEKVTEPETKQAVIPNKEVVTK